VNQPGAIIAAVRLRGTNDWFGVSLDRSLRGADVDRVLWLSAPSASMRRAVIHNLCPVVGEEVVVSEDALDLGLYEPQKPSCASEDPVVTSSFVSSSPGSSEASLK
jgi:hypothetical protein